MGKAMPDMVTSETNRYEVVGDQQPTLRLMPMPHDLNANGDVFGGWIMAQIDIAGATVAMRRAHGRVVTVAVKSIEFKQPVSVGDLVSFYARVVSVGVTSITVGVEVFAERNPAEPHIVKVTEAVLTYVAVDSRGSKRQLPDLD